MEQNLGPANYARISAFDSEINSGWYRVVLRVGFHDLDDDNVYDQGIEAIDYHWWYQTSDGNWADKPGGYPSEYHDNTTDINPALLPWSLEYLDGMYLYYDSVGVFYQVKDLRTVAW